MVFKKQKIQYLIASVKDEKAIAAIPIEKEKNENKILRVDSKLSQIFKDFPLIGSSPIKWNAVINSNSFYPD